MFSAPMNGQEIDHKYPEIGIQEAVAIAKENYPLLKQKQLELTKQELLKSTALDLGTTRIFTSGEEINDERGVYTVLGIAQSNIDVFGITQKKRLQKQRIELAKKAYQISERQLEMQVKQAWANAYQYQKKYQLYTELDTIYTNFEKAVTLQYEVEAISRLAYTASKNQALQIRNIKEQVRSDYAIALEQLNLWLLTDVFYTVSNDDQVTITTIKEFAIETHPEFTLAQNLMQEAEANYKAAKGNNLPKLNLRGGLQKVNGNTGFYTYQAGISLPFLSGDHRAQIKTARINKVSVYLYGKKLGTKLP